MKKVFFILLLTVIYVQAIELGTKSYTILIDIPKLEAEGYTPAQLLAKGKKTIQEANGQPFRLTRLVNAKSLPIKVSGQLVKENTNYFRILIVPNTQTEVNFFKLLKQNDIAEVIQAGNIITRRNRLGEFIEWESIKVNDLPSDFYIEISTP